MAADLEDPHPDRVRIRVGRVAVIEMWGDFKCQSSELAQARPPQVADRWDQG